MTYDRAYLLQQRRTEHILHINEGVNYVEAVQSLLAECGIALIISTPTKYALQTAREDWEIGTDYLSIVNQLLSEINYRDVWFNADGAAVLEPIKTPAASGIDHVLDTGKIHSVMHRDCKIETDIFDKPNVFVVVCSNPDLPEPLTAISENNNPNSAFSTTRRGMRVTKLFKVDNIASSDALQAYANELCFQSMLSSEIITVKTAALPGHGIGDTVALIHPEIEGICEETAWYLELRAGAYMTHELKKVVFV